MIGVLRTLAQINVVSEDDGSVSVMRSAPEVILTYDLPTPPPPGSGGQLDWSIDGNPLFETV